MLVRCVTHWLISIMPTLIDVLKSYCMFPLFTVCENEVCPEIGVEKSLPVPMFQTKSSELKHPLRRQRNPSEKMRDNFEREWGRFKAIIMDRVQEMLFPEHDASGSKYMIGLLLLLL